MHRGVIHHEYRPQAGMPAAQAQRLKRWTNDEAEEASLAVYFLRNLRKLALRAAVVILIGTALAIARIVVQILLAYAGLRIH